MNRSALLGATARLAALAALGQLGACTQPGPFKFDRDPFTLGVASGDPLPDGVVLWTRLAPDPLAGGRMAMAPVDVDWLVARDEAMTDVVRSGTYGATADLAHSVHVEVSGLEPDRVYRSEEHTSETPVTSYHLVCRLLLEKKKKKQKKKKKKKKKTKKKKTKKIRKK